MVAATGYSIDLHGHHRRCDRKLAVVSQMSRWISLATNQQWLRNHIMRRALALYTKLKLINSISVNQSAWLTERKKIIPWKVSSFFFTLVIFREDVEKYNWFCFCSTISMHNLWFKIKTTTKNNEIQCQLHIMVPFNYLKNKN